VFAAKDQKAITLARLLEEIVPVIGVPETLLSDCGTNRYLVWKNFTPVHTTCSVMA